ncbi:serine/threonine-protein kinase grp [Contarinia nasturtii]|uniref:serine/threonine-protein kinase grp n=1 Tax=Contarinia nasturtii TaxID=265458 RepID=UPI0012D493D9|nr:serine/threonine-protein kinase grp [Contarinia nasturtii]XP_031618984.1 serine/threonine-protein kinase grp [Contarinia nasturtii]
MASQNGNREEFVEGWTLAQTLGEGAYGEVKLLLNKQTGEAVAMKMVDTRKHPDASASVKKEVCIQKFLQHTHILRYFGTRRQNEIEYIFLEYAAGGELFDRIEPDIGMRANEARHFFNQLMDGVNYLHGKGVAHRDLKPENLLLDEHDNLKISDFGMATMFRIKGKERLLDKRCGTLPYVAPEILVRPYNATAADIWSCGVILVAMLSGELPWDEPTTGCAEFVKWKGDNSWMTITPWSKLETLALSLLRKLLEPDSGKRITVKEIIEHKWCKLSETVENDRETPRAKRFRPNDFMNVDKPVNLSQPVPQTVELKNVAGDDQRNDFCFSQPTLMEDLILCTQMNPTQNTQNPFHRLVKRMTRFSVTTTTDDTVKRIIDTVSTMGYTWKKTDINHITVSTIDRRKINLVFKINLIEMNNVILVDFRLSKGDGIEFKRRFIQIKKSLADIIGKEQHSW